MRTGRTGGGWERPRQDGEQAIGGMDGEQPREVQAADTEETCGGVVVAMETGETTSLSRTGRVRSLKAVMMTLRHGGQVTQLPQPA